MAHAPPEIISEVNRTLNSIRSAFDIGNISRGRVNGDLEAIRRAYLRLEDIRFSFRADSGRYRRQEGAREEIALEQLALSLLELAHDHEFMTLAHSLRYRMVPTMGRVREAFYLHPQLMDNAISAGDAIRLLIESLRSFGSLSIRTEAESLARSAEKLRRLVPQQKISPVRFDILSDKLIISPQPAETAAEDMESVRSARAELVDRGAKLIEELGRSNCDPRLLGTVTELQSQLVEQNDIVRLGIANLGCSMMYGAFEKELPDAIGAMLRSQTLGVNMYVAQFPEWNRFSENAAAAELDEDAVRQIHETAGSLIADLEKRPELADPQVPKTIAYLNMLIADPSEASKRAAFAVLRTVENLVIRVYQHGADFFDKTAQKATEALSTTAARLMTAALLAVALAGATGLAPVAVRLEGSAWLAKASEIVSKQLNELSK